MQKRGIVQDKKQIRLFEKEADRIWRLLHPKGTSRKRPPIRIVYSRNRGASGRWDGYEALVRIPKQPVKDYTWHSDEWVWSTLAHELCHAATGDRHGEGAHGRSFYMALKEVCERRWKVRIDYSFINGRTNSSHSWGYKVDYAITKQLREAKCVKFQFNPTSHLVETSTR